jgi:hypothetical protein
MSRSPLGVTHAGLTRLVSYSVRHPVRDCGLGPVLPDDRLTGPHGAIFHGEKERKVDLDGIRGTEDESERSRSLS